MPPQVTTTTATNTSQASSQSRRFVPNLSQHELEELREAFTLFDADGKGRISGKELREVMQSLLVPNRNTTSATTSVDDTTNISSSSKFANIQLLLEKMKWQDVELDFNEFVDLVTSDHREQQLADDGESEEDAGVRRVFDLFDHDKKGYISLNDLKQIAQELGETMEENELQEMLDRASPSGDGLIRFEDFRNVMTKKLFFTEK